ncbi:MAG: hypothetical protein ACKV0T_07340 [Planctomycetales bacterium]
MSTTEFVTVAGECKLRYPFWAIDPTTANRAERIVAVDRLIAEANVQEAAAGPQRR